MTRIARSLLLLLLASMLGACASTGDPGDRIFVEITSEPGEAEVTFKGKSLGPAPLSLDVASMDDLMEIVAKRPQSTLVERRVRVVDAQHSQVLFRFDDKPTPLAKALGLANVVVFDYSERATFDSDEYEVKPEFLALLVRQAELLNTAFAGIDVYVCGHTDDSGGVDHNMLLSVRRAQSVSDVLEANGVDPDRLHVQGFGEDYPIAANGTTLGKAMNRRTEVLLPQ